MREVFDAVRDLHATAPETPWLLLAGSDSWILGLLTMPDLKVDIASQLEPDALNAVASTSPSGEVLILVLNHAWTIPAETENAHQLICFKDEKDSSVYIWRLPAKAQSQAALERGPEQCAFERLQ